MHILVVMTGLTPHLAFYLAQVGPLLSRAEVCCVGSRWGLALCGGPSHGLFLSLLGDFLFLLTARSLAVCSIRHLILDCIQGLVVVVGMVVLILNHSVLLAC